MESIWGWVDKFEGIKNEGTRYKNELELSRAIDLISSEDLACKYSELIEV